MMSVNCRTLLALVGASILAGCPGATEGPGDLGGVSTPAPPTPPDPRVGPVTSATPLTVSRGFQCDEEGLSASESLYDKDGYRLAIQPAGDPCKFDLVLYAPGYDGVLLSAEPSGYLFGFATPTADGVAVCASRIDHADTDAGHQMQRVTIECGLQGPAPIPLTPVVSADKDDWAAWILGLEPSNSGVTLAYARDFSFQFMNLKDAGRPAEDGWYKVELTSGDGWTVAEPTKTSASVNPFAQPSASSSVEGWHPTAEEIQTLEAGQHQPNSP